MKISEQLEVIESHWYEEAMAFKSAGDTLRGSLDGENRMRALGERTVRLENSDALIDAWLDIRDEQTS